jgi:hypothetical protein
MPLTQPQSESVDGRSLNMIPSGQVSDAEVEETLQTLLNLSFPQSMGGLLKTPNGLRVCVLLEQWQSLGQPRPEFSSSSGRLSEWLPGFERFLDSYTHG